MEAFVRKMVRARSASGNDSTCVFGDRKSMRATDNLSIDWSRDSAKDEKSESHSHDAYKRLSVSFCYCCG